MNKTKKKKNKDCKMIKEMKQNGKNSQIELKIEMRIKMKKYCKK